jgi:FAD/FMN-containing dehydrogenase
MLFPKNCLPKLNGLGGNMITRRQFLKISGGVISLLPLKLDMIPTASAAVVVNDIHSQLNATSVKQIVKPESIGAVVKAIQNARRDNLAVCISGGRHSMGAQAFATDGMMLDIRALNRVLSFDDKAGLIEVESGIEWPELADYLLKVQQGRVQQWGFKQKQTGADRLTIGGAIASNIHGRGLAMKPFVDDIDSFTLIDARGDLIRCSRNENSELFKLVIGGYGLFGFVYSARLRLTPRRKVQRIVEVIDVEEVMPSFERRISDGFLYGDYQFAINEASDSFLRKGVFSCYKPVDAETPVPPDQKQLSEANWADLIYLAHVDKEEAFRRYAGYYLSTFGQVYWSDTNQMSFYPDNYHLELDQRLHSNDKATEMITEIYVERSSLPLFMNDVRALLRKSNDSLIYGTVRLIEKDDETFLNWAKKPYVCIIFNLHVKHTPEGIRHSADTFRKLIDLGIRYGGSYYLTYHKFATREQVLKCYAQFPEFLRQKKRYDPKEVFQSDWYRFYKKMFSDVA